MDTGVEPEQGLMQQPQALEESSVQKIDNLSFEDIKALYETYEQVPTIRLRTTILKGLNSLIQRNQLEAKKVINEVEIAKKIAEALKAPRLLFKRLEMIGEKNKNLGVLPPEKSSVANSELR
jgi:hypothetical protein